MLENLLESKRRRTGMARSITSSAFSLAVHSGIIFGAVVGTMKSETAEQPAARQVETSFVLTPPEKEDVILEPVESPRPILSRIPTAPIRVPTGIPPIDSGQVYDWEDLRDLEAVESVFDVLETSEPVGSAEVFSVSTVDETPIRISSPPLEYPRTMQRAGVEGTVLVQAVIDSTGRVERGSVEVLQSDQAAFDAAAKRLVERSLFQPGRVRGRPVRVLIQIPVQFSLVGIRRL